MVIVAYCVRKKNTLFKSNRSDICNNVFSEVKMARTFVKIREIVEAAPLDFKSKRTKNIDSPLFAKRIVDFRHPV